MTENKFRKLMNLAKLIGVDYVRGYQRGLRRKYHGEKFGTTAEHLQWLNCNNNRPDRAELARGYRDGFKGKNPKELRLK